VLALDIFLNGVREAKLRGVHDDYVLADCRFLPFRDKAFSTVICIEVIEHLVKAEGIKLLDEVERVAYEAIYLTTPISYPQSTDIIYKNPYQEHKSFWQPYEFESQGYKTFLFSSFLSSAIRTVNSSKCSLLNKLLANIILHVIAVFAKTFHIHLSSNYPFSIVCSKRLRVI
jgi:ubiquinone/menaquinone biosynthesis C-methylase UbiE